MELPDFEDMSEAIEKISSLALKKSLLEIEIKKGESLVFTTAMSDPAYLQGGKQPSSAYVENAYKYTGLNGELIPLRVELAVTGATLEKERLSFDLMKDSIEIWRSEMATARVSLTV
jgi:hypothetical protein